MGTVAYTVFDGEIVEENRDGVIRDYVPDSLGSTRALLDNSQNKTDTWTYWPYGEEQSRTGAVNTPFTFVGTLGYYSGGAGGTYVRARWYSSSLSAWKQVDHIWPHEMAYQYAYSNPVGNTDPTGLSPVMLCGSCWCDKINKGTQPYAACIACTTGTSKQKESKCRGLQKSGSLKWWKHLCANRTDVLPQECCKPSQPGTDNCKRCCNLFAYFGLSGYAIFLSGLKDLSKDNPFEFPASTCEKCNNECIENCDPRNPMTGVLACINKLKADNIRAIIGAGLEKAKPKG